VRILLIIAALIISPTSFAEIGDSSQYRTIEVKSSSISTAERNVRSAAVEILTEIGHGSGSLVRYRGTQFVITAQHIASGESGTRYIIQKEKEIQSGALVYSDLTNDIAILWLENEFESVEPMRFSITKSIPDVGEEITYSGYPSSHEIMTYRGRVAGFEEIEGVGKQILLHTFGWFGCSGSVVFNSRGNIVGVLWGIDLLNGIPVESMIWVSPIQNLDIDLALSEFCKTSGENVRACR
jgi:S1-C subfamily serine protease